MRGIEHQRAEFQGEPHREFVPPFLVQMEKDILIQELFQLDVFEKGRSRNSRMHDTLEMQVIGLIYLLRDRFGGLHEI